MVSQVKPEDKARVVEELTRDEIVAATVTTGLLRRPDVAFRAMSDDTARHQVNHAQVERGAHRSVVRSQVSPAWGWEPLILMTALSWQVAPGIPLESRGLSTPCDVIPAFEGVRCRFA